MAGGHLDTAACRRRGSNEEKMTQLQPGAQQRAGKEGAATLVYGQRGNGEGKYRCSICKALALHRGENAELTRWRNVIAEFIRSLDLSNALKS